ncbi:MAG: transposase [Kordiimonadaceae bacterium]|nr:transposase [Kordiimonadaceae bacterium]
MSDKKQKTYTDQFRREAVRRADQPGITARQVADDLGIHVNLIYNWRSQFKKIEKLRSGETVRHQFHETGGVDYSKAERDEIRKLKKQIAELEEERDFLKKATAYFAKPNK